MSRGLSDDDLAAYLRGAQTAVGGDVPTTNRPPTAHHAVPAEPDAYTARSGDRPAGGVGVPPTSAPPATYDEYRPISDGSGWYALDPDEPIPLWHIGLVLLVGISLWVLIVVGLYQAAMWWQS